VDNAVDSNTGTIKLKAAYPNTDRRLWPGLFVNVSLRLGTRADAIVVPSQAVQAGQAGYYVYAIKQDSTAELRLVVPGMIIGGDTVIEKGVGSGETVVTDGHIRLIPGAQVQIKEAAQKMEERSS